MEIKKLCVAIHSLQVGGMERVMSELAWYFCQRNDLEVHLLLYGRRPEIFYKLPVSLIIHKPSEIFNDKFRFYASLKRLHFVRKTIKEIKPDSILNFGELWNSFILLALWGLPYPIYISDRCSPARQFSKYHTLLRRWLYPRAQGIIAQTETAKLLYASQFKNNNIQVIGNPIKQIQHENLSLERENIVLTVGRLIQTKHHDKLIELFADPLFSKWKLIIIGDDALKQTNKENLNGLIHRLGIAQRVVLAGTQLNVESYLLRSKIFVFTSSSEGFPNAIGEAMSAGLPVIAFDCIAGPSELVQNGVTGFLVPLFDYAGIKEKLLLLMRNENVRKELGLNAPKVIHKYAPKKIGDQYYSFLLS